MTLQGTSFPGRNALDAVVILQLTSVSTRRLTLDNIAVKIKYSASTSAFNSVQIYSSFNAPVCSR